jgi:hypothetical protein
MRCKSRHRGNGRRFPASTFVSIDRARAVSANLCFGRLSSRKRIDDRPASKLPSARGFLWRIQWPPTTSTMQFGEQAMKFTVTSGAGVTEVIDRPASARAALKLVLALLGRTRTDVRIFDEDGRRRSPADLCGWQRTKLQCCQMNLG